MPYCAFDTPNDLPAPPFACGSRHATAPDSGGACAATGLCRSARPRTCRSSWSREDGRCVISAFGDKDFDAPRLLGSDADAFERGIALVPESGDAAFAPEDWHVIAVRGFRATMHGTPRPLGRGGAYARGRSALRKRVRAAGKEPGDVGDPVPPHRPRPVPTVRAAASPARRLDTVDSEFLCPAAGRASWYQTARPDGRAMHDGWSNSVQNPQSLTTAAAGTASTGRLKRGCSRCCSSITAVHERLTHCQLRLESKMESIWSNWWKRATKRASAPRCFISYSRSDGWRYAKALEHILFGQGLVVLWDMNFSPSANWATTLRDEIHTSDYLILIGTPDALESTYVRLELQYFQDHGRGTMLPIMFRDITPVSMMPAEILGTTWLIEDPQALQDGPSHHVMSALFVAFHQPLPSYGPRSLKPKPPLEAEESRPLNQAKLILVGRGEVGKTSVVRRLVSDEFRGDESKTQGITITQWALAPASERFLLNVWDFGGQEIMHSTHQFFLTERSVYLLVLNGREGGEDANAEYWLKHIESFGGNSPVIIVQNKIAQHPFDMNYRGLQARYPQIHAFVKTDCRSGQGLTELREIIERTLVAMPEIRMNFPLDWLRVKERIESMEAEYLSENEFSALCRDKGIVDEQQRAALSWALHCLGIALHYRDDVRLRETSILKPEWVTQGIYKILTTPELLVREGELHLDDLPQLLPKERYPVEKHLFLVELMRKFSLCFAFPDDSNRYLVPELLGKEEPEETASFRPAECLNFEYRYGVLPEGLVPRFIVRSHTLSRGQERWRSGVVLAHEDCKALVTAHSGDRRVVVRVKGGDAGARRRLLAIVRYDLDRINAEFKDRLDVQPRVPLSDSPSFSVEYKKLVAFEKQGITRFPDFVDERVVTVNVDELLNGVDLDAQREQSLDDLARAKAIFFSYSHKDEFLRDELETHLKLLQRQSVISTWHDRKIFAGTEWDREIDNRIERAHIILLLISADFLASDYCWDKEVKRAMERHNSGEATVVPVLLRSCDWQDAPFSKLEGLPTEMKPVTLWEDRDVAWTAVAQGIRTIAETGP